VNTTLVTIETEYDLRNAFLLQDRKRLEIPDNLRFPLTFDHYMTWTESTGRYQYLAFRKYGRAELVGMVFDRSGAGQPGRTQMCSWCQTTGSSDKIDMLSMDITAKVLVGVIVCINLNCLENLETISKLSKKSPERLAQEIVDRMSHFYEQKFEPGH
jgi:hypothetical protein